MILGTPQITRIEYFRIEVPVGDLPWKEVHARAVAAVHYLFDVLGVKRVSKSIIKRELTPEGTFREFAIMSGQDDKETILREMERPHVKNPLHPGDFVGFHFHSQVEDVSKEPLPGYQDPEYRFSRDELV